jgi:hypothetical protein
MTALFNEKELPKETAKKNKKPTKTPFLVGQWLICNGVKGRFIEEIKGTFIIINEAGKRQAINPKIKTGSATGEKWKEPVEVVIPHKEGEWQEC